MALYYGGAIITAIFGFIGMLVGRRLRSKFKKYAQTPVANGLSGKQVAEKMLHENGLHDVRILNVRGQLTDHYNPKNRTVNLSDDVYHGVHMSAAAVAAHECGHAIQHATSYSMLGLRSKLVPIVNVSSKIMNIAFIGLGIASYALGQYGTELALMVIIACYSAFALFALVTLPVEFDASKRALAWIEDKRIYSNQEYDMAKDALWWAAMTYMVSALGSVVQVLYYLMILMSRRR